MHRPGIATLLALAGALHALPAESDDVFLPLDGFAIVGESPAPEPLTLAVSRFVREVTLGTGR